MICLSGCLGFMRRQHIMAEVCVRGHIMPEVCDGGYIMSEVCDRG